jgi:hypothetical protein
MGILNAFVAAYIYGLLPEFLLRFIAWLLINFIYRLERRGSQNIPERGPALLICNHVSYADAIVISAGCQRPVRFIMESSIFRIPVLSTIFRGSREGTSPRQSGVHLPRRAAHIGWRDRGVPCRDAANLERDARACDPNGALRFVGVDVFSQIHSDMEALATAILAEDQDERRRADCP